MSETKGLVKCVLGFLLAIIVIVGGAFGLDVQVNVEDAETTNSEVVEENFVNTTAEENNVLATDEVVETEQSPVESAPTEDEEPSEDMSVEAEVTTTTDEIQNVVTEKGEN